ncbi:hypothetical protein [Clostridium gasigenes]|uniref:hypothetical protein n=1 Tax=Clostridium gasigenes TaxID=94869 RepID=UPI001C0C6D03|nr:hypothetical protein [Clostridium gasigenes]MBU3107026.1 hypothetical protein [Clostridium gasigenes]
MKMQWGILGAILTAILISRGATFTHELISKVSNIKGETFKEDVKTTINKFK